ncbi:MAG: DUF2235 domain-containing protein [Burkholderiaceae bacterium]|nr:DUF2235 domain-containing protein [Burkholderiaceae bacterium]
MRPFFHLLGAMCLFAAANLSQAQANCEPSQLGEPCSGGGLAVLGPTEPAVNLGVGNPIHLITGNKYQKETDLPANASAFGLEVIRHYNSLDPKVSVLGRGWRLAYDTRLFKAGGRWQVLQADGSRIQFQADGQATRPGYGRLDNKHRHYLWRWPNGQVLEFDPYGYLAGIVSTKNERLRILRTSQPGVPRHAITSVINHQGVRLDFTYRPLGAATVLDSIQTPLGRYRYDYDVDVRLLSLTRPDGMQKRYLYEADHQAGNAHALTGIELLSADGLTRHRLNTWSYDASGRAISSIQGPPDSKVGKISLEYVTTPHAEQRGLTKVINANQQTTLFTTQVRNDRYLISQVSGAPCSGCAAPDTLASYDNQGQLQELHGVKLRRDPKGKLRGISVTGQGWPDLNMEYLPSGQRSAWTSTLTGAEHMSYDTQGRPNQRRFANGDTTTYHYDAQGRPSVIDDANAAGVLQTTLGWHGRLLTQIRHPYESETRHYDAQQRTIRRQIERPGHGSSTPLRYAESFEYDAQHRLSLHHLPEGGALSYTWDDAGPLAAIRWHDVHGDIHTVIDTVSGQAGYRYDNGLHLRTVLNQQQQASRLLLTQDQTLIWSQKQHYDKQGRLQQEEHLFADAQPDLWRYAYNPGGQMTGATQLRANTPPSNANKNAGTHWYAWHADGSSAAIKHQNATVIPSIQRDASGLPLTMDGKQLDYGPNRRLTEVRQQGLSLVRYRHNAFGYQIHKRGQHVDTHYLYLDNKLVAQAENGSTITRRYIYAHHILVGFIDYQTVASQPTDTAHVTALLYAVHSDLTGAPRLVTDVNGKIRWRAHYLPTGLAVDISGDLTLDLRLPGQVYDALTGWHDNLLRTYLPHSGQYLEPDPLGPVPGQQALGYAAQQPRRHIDPMGLLLFAFDGTRNDPATLSNIWKMSQYYQDGAVYYHSGPGNPMYIDWDAITADQASKIIDTQWQSLLNELDGNPLNDSIPIDIIGYSRGAALARHFGNLINQHVNDGLFTYNDTQRGLITACVDMRFMGLFDTVAQMGLAGTQNHQYDLSIAAAWGWVAHAVALNERRVLYPLTVAADTGGGNIIEAPFIGAHADIGGGMALSEARPSDQRGDLADVALNWMLWQARAASLRFGDVALNDRIITNPTLHDERAPLLRSVQDGDRSVDSSAGVLLHHYQDDHATLGRDTRASAEAAIIRNDNWRRQPGTEVGMVDMSGYARWLHDELGWQALPV